MTTIANDMIVDAGLTVIVVGVTVFYLVAAFVLRWLVAVPFGSPSDTPFVAEIYWIVALSYILVAIIVGTTVEVLRSSFKAVFVCFVQVKLYWFCCRGYFAAFLACLSCSVFPLIGPSFCFVCLCHWRRCRRKRLSLSILLGRVG